MRNRGGKKTSRRGAENEHETMIKEGKKSRR
jgi:hypothetical protein